MRNKTVYQSFQRALEGFIYLWKTHKHFKFEFVAAAAVIILGLIFGLSKLRWFVLIFTIILGLVIEIFNTCIEEVCNLITKDYNSKVKIIKDMSGAAVLIFVLYSVIVALVIFAPSFGINY